MGEEEKKKPEEKKTEEPKTEEKKAEEPKELPPPSDAEPPAPPPPEIVLRVYMHCEGCARKIRRCLRGFPGVEEVETDCKAHKVVVKGEKADPVAVLERVQRKSHRHVELLSPIPKPPAEDPKKPEEKAVEKPPEKKQEVITVILKVYMHCEACAQEIRRRILKMDGVEEVEPDLKSSQVTVKGIFDPPNLVEYVHKRTGKHAIIVKEEPDNKKEEEKGKEEKKADGGDDKAAAEDKKDGGGEVAEPPPAEGEEVVAGVIDLKRNEYYYNYPQNYHVYPYPQRYEMQSYYTQYPPQMFSDENPNACSVM